MAGMRLPDDAMPHYNATIENLRAYVDCFELSLTDSDVQAMHASIKSSLGALSRLWKYDLDGVGTSIKVQNSGK
jgi:hypothetical protein